MLVLVLVLVCNPGKENHHTVTGDSDRYLKALVSRRDDKRKRQERRCDIYNLF